jgi:hypothetical protein
LLFSSSIQKQKKPPAPYEAGGVFALNRYFIGTRLRQHKPHHPAVLPTPTLVEVSVAHHIHACVESFRLVMFS